MYRNNHRYGDRPDKYSYTRHNGCSSAYGYDRDMPGYHPPVIDYDDMKLTSFFRFTIVRSVGSDRLPGAGACQQAGEDT